VLGGGGRGKGLVSCGGVFKWVLECLLKIQREMGKGRKKKKKGKKKKVVGGGGKGKRISCCWGVVQ